MSTTITADASTLMNQASATAHEYLREAVRRIDGDLGDGYAKEHPAVLAAFMAAAVEDFRTAIIAQAMQDATERLAMAIMTLRDERRQ